MSPKSPVDMLGRAGIFEGLSRKDLNEILASAKEMEYPEGKTVVTEGENGVSFHLILQGKAKVVVGKRTRATLGPGDYFGELSVIDRGPRTASVTAATPLKTLTLVSWDFLAVLDENPKIARKMLIEMCKRLRRERDAHTY